MNQKFNCNAVDDLYGVTYYIVRYNIWFIRHKDEAGREGRQGTSQAPTSLRGALLFYLYLIYSTHPTFIVNQIKKPQKTT